MKHNLLFILLITFLVACNNNPETEKATTASEKQNVSDGTSGDNLITFKVNGETVTTNLWNISWSVMPGRKVLNITSDMNKEPRTIMFNVNGSSTGTYKLSNTVEAMKQEGLGYGSYRPDYKKNMMDIYNFKDGELSISSIDTIKNILNATFSGTVRNEKDEAISITEGKVINGKILPGTTNL